jgi:lipopolysaccharide export system protein LptA
VLSAVIGSPAGAQKAGAPPKNTETEFPLRITAARLEADQPNRLITFSGQVKAEYGKATLFADQVRIFYQPGAATKTAAAPAAPPAGQDADPLAGLGSEKIDRIEAKGKVRLVQEDKVASGQEAIFYKNRDEVVLTGNPQLWRGDNNLKGEKIIFNLKQNRVLVESSAAQRVEAHLYPQTKGSPMQPKELLPDSRKRDKAGSRQ